MQNTLYDVLIIGGGPSGLTASIYTSRAELSTLVVSGNPSGGQLMWTTEVENFPGFPKGIMGPDLISEMRKQAERFNVLFADENVNKISGGAKKGFIIETDEKNTYSAKSIIVATGASANWLNLPNEQRLRGAGVSACATCDGFFFKDKVVAVVGGGDAAMEEALYLTKYASKVYALVRGTADSMRASKIMQKRAFDNEKIEFLFNTQVKDVLGEKVVEALLVENVLDKSLTNLVVNGLFVAIGHTPNTSFLNGFLEVDVKGYLKPNHKASESMHATTASSVEGIFIAGDVHDFRYRQAITAAGYGCMAAIDVERYLAEI